MNRPVPARDSGNRRVATCGAPAYPRALPRARRLARGVTDDSKEFDVGRLVSTTRAFLAGDLVIRQISPRRDVGRVWRNAGYCGGLFRHSVAGGEPNQSGQVASDGLR